MSKGIKSILSVALPIIGTIALPGVGTALGASLGIGATAGAALTGAGIGAGTAALTGGNVLKGAALGGVGGYLGGGGLTDLGITGPGSILGEAASNLQGPTQTGAALGEGSGFLGKVSSYLPSISDITGGAGGGSNIGTLLTAGNAISGIAGANAAEKAGKLQYQATQDALRQGAELRAPYVQAGADAQGRYTDLLTNPQAQLDFVQNNPFYQSLADDAKRRLLASQATKGKIASGGTASALQTELLNLGSGLVSNQLSGLDRSVTVGANAASGQATQGADLLTSGAAAKAAGGVGAVNAGTGAYQNTIATLLALKRLNQGGDLLKNSYSPAL